MLDGNLGVSTAMMDVFGWRATKNGVLALNRSAHTLSAVLESDDETDKGEYLWGGGVAIMWK